MVGVDSKVGEEKRLAARPLTATIWFHCDEYSVDLVECFCVFRPNYPALIGDAVLKKNS
jgi:hypothetical protein